MKAMLSPEQVSAVIVTKGDTDLKPILDSLPFSDVIVWDNSARLDLRVYGRYWAIDEAKNPVIYTQDDDCIVDVAAVIAEYEPGYVTCNMPTAKRQEYETLAPHVALVGWGACFEARLAALLWKYVDRYGVDELFERECDRVFTSLTPKKLIDVPLRHLPNAAIDRMGNEPRHLKDLAEIQRRIAAL